MLDRKILDALLSEPSISAAARAADCSREAVYRRLKSPAFVKLLNEELENRRKIQAVQSSAALESALKVLRQTLDDPLGTSKRDLLKAVELALRYLQR